MSRGRVVVWRGRAAKVVQPCAVAGWFCVLAATAFSAAASADPGPATGATVPGQPQPAKTAKFEDFVRQVGIDMTTVPIAVRRDWASAPRLIIDDCGIPGTHAGHSHAPDRGEQAVNQAGAGEVRSDR